MHEKFKRVLVSVELVQHVEQKIFRDHHDALETGGHPCGMQASRHRNYKGPGILAGEDLVEEVVRQAVVTKVFDELFAPRPVEDLRAVEELDQQNDVGHPRVG